MAYGDFSLRDVLKSFGLTLCEAPDLFGTVAEVEPGAMLRELLREYNPLALAINTEKARSELLIAPLLVEVRSQLHHRVSYFSGVEFSVDASLGLSGYCDFLLSQSPEQQFIRSPVLTVVEAKNENLKSGFGQCAAEMVGARLFNERDGTPVPAVYGVVTTGTLWRFLQLEGAVLNLDQHEYHIERVAKVLGILMHVLRP
jgi:hypothetical protein